MSTPHFWDKESEGQRLSHHHKNVQFTLGKMFLGLGSNDRGRNDVQSMFGNVRGKNSAVGWEPRCSVMKSLRPGMSLNPAVMGLNPWCVRTYLKHVCISQCSARNKYLLVQWMNSDSPWICSRAVPVVASGFFLHSRVVRGGPPGEVRYSSLPPQCHQATGGLVKKGVLKSHLSSEPRKDIDKFPHYKPETRIHCTLLFFNGLMTIYKDTFWPRTFIFLINHRSKTEAVSSSNTASRHFQGPPTDSAWRSLSTTTFPQYNRCNLCC